MPYRLADASLLRSDGRSITAPSVPCWLPRLHFASKQRIIVVTSSLPPALSA